MGSSKNITATVGTDTIEGGCAGGRRYADHDVVVVDLVGEGVTATATFNSDGEADVTGTYPRAMYVALVEIAEAARDWNDDGRASTTWTVDAAGAVDLADAAAAAA